MNVTKVGIIGCGNISGIYFKNAKELFGNYEIAACADIDVERAKAKAVEQGIAKGCSVEELLADPDIKLVINLTIPAAHADVCMQALRAGKHVYVEKPLSVTREDGKKLLELAAEKGLRVGCAPDTFLGGGIQTCIKLIRDGWIGHAVGATGFMASGGPESWHPAPEFFYQTGGGPMFDMGPYYLTAMVAMLGPIERVTGSARITYPERIVTSEPKYGQTIAVEVPTHVSGVFDFRNGAVGSLMTSFDIAAGSTLPRIEVYGSLGTIVVPDPNTFGGPIKYRRKGTPDWADIPLTHGFAENGRGIGVADMVDAIAKGREHLASGQLAYHVLEAMHGFHDASREGKHYAMQSICSTPEPLPVGMTKLHWR